MPATYSPILRNGRNERQVIQSFGGFRHFDDSEYSVSLSPIVEVESEEDLDDLPVYQDAGEQVYVDLPEYLGEKSTKLTEGINETLKKYGSREEFLRSNSRRIDFPIISGFPDTPVQYGIHTSLHRALEDTYLRVAHRLMVVSRKSGLSKKQKEELRRLAEVARPSKDVVMLDIVDIELSEGSKVKDDVEYLANLFREFDTGILNAFNALDGQTENFSPGLADEFGCELFGDFAIDRRYPPAGGGRPKSVNLTHYHPAEARAEIFPGGDYADAGRDLLRWSEWRADHCDYCREIASLVEQEKGEDFNRWKRTRMGHYIESVVRGGV